MINPLSWVQKNFEKGIEILTSNTKLKEILFPLYKALRIKKLRFYLLNRLYNSGSEEVLAKAKEALDQVNAFFWLDFGTLLGAIRENDFIKHDLDIDIGMKLEDYSDKIDSAMKNAGFRKTYQYEINGGRMGMEQSYEREGTKIDIFYYQFEENQMWTYIYDSAGQGETSEMKAIAQYFPYNGFDTMLFKGKEFNIPKYPEQYLAYHYGDDFLVPQKNWNYKKDALNTRECNEFKVKMTKYS